MSPAVPFLPMSPALEGIPGEEDGAMQLHDAAGCFGNYTFFILKLIHVTCVVETRDDVPIMFKKRWSACGFNITRNDACGTAGGF